MSSQNSQITKPTPQLFDVIVGNPPYGSHLDEKSKEYLHKIYPNVPDYEIYMYFLRKGLDLLNENGILSYIFPNTFLSINNGIELRKWILDNFDILRITDLSNDKTFEDASVRTCIFTVRKSKKENNITEFWEIIPNEKKFQKKSEFSREFLKENVSNWLTLFSYSKENQEIIDKMKNGQKVADICEVSQGYIPYDKYRGHDEFTIKNRIWHADNKKDETYRRELKGGDVEKYSVKWNGGLWISYGNWLAAPRRQDFFINPRILVREIADENLFCAYSEEEFYNTPSIINIIHPENNKVVLKFILGVLNTKLMGWYHQNTSPKAKKGLFPKILVNDVRNLPIPKATTEQQTQIAELVDQIMVLKTNSQNLANSFLKLVIAKYKPSTISTKLKHWHKLEIADFLDELKKQKAVIGGLSQEAELMAYFDEQKAKVLELEKGVERVDGEIEGLIRGLYGIEFEGNINNKI
jgi:hypothetical protein